jgi:hypothetical protein
MDDFADCRIVSAVNLTALLKTVAELKGCSQYGTIAWQTVERTAVHCQAKDSSRILENAALVIWPRALCMSTDSVVFAA